MNEAQRYAGNWHEQWSMGQIENKTDKICITTCARSDKLGFPSKAIIEQPLPRRGFLSACLMVVYRGLTNLNINQLSRKNLTCRHSSIRQFIEFRMVNKLFLSCCGPNISLNKKRPRPLCAGSWSRTFPDTDKHTRL